MIWELSEIHVMMVIKIVLYNKNIELFLGLKEKFKGLNIQLQ